MGILNDEVEGTPGRVEITDPAILEYLIVPSDEAIAGIRRMNDLHAAALHQMRLHPERYLVAKGAERSAPYYISITKKNSAATMMR